MQVEHSEVGTFAADVADMLQEMAAEEGLQTVSS